MLGDITLYGDGGSWETERLRNHLDRLGVPYRFVSTREANAASAQAPGEREMPRVYLSDGRNTRLLGAPNETAIDVTLRRWGLLPAA